MSDTEAPQKERRISPALFLLTSETNMLQHCNLVKDFYFFFKSPSSLITQGKMKVFHLICQFHPSHQRRLTPKQQYTVEMNMTAIRIMRQVTKKPIIRPELQTTQSGCHYIHRVYFWLHLTAFQIRLPLFTLSLTLCRWNMEVGIVCVCVCGHDRER